MRRAATADILKRLAADGVEFVVVGMTAGVLQGAPVSTFDLDVVHRRTPDNVQRLLRVLAQIGAVTRHDPRRLRPEASHLLGPGHLLLGTSAGDLDCLGTIGDGRGFEELLPDSLQMEIGQGLKVRVLSLPALIEAKEKAGRPKDLAALPVLRATLAETRRRS